MNNQIPNVQLTSWSPVVQAVLKYPKHTDLKFFKRNLPSIPKIFTKRRADNDGQNEDYGMALDDNCGIHIKVYDDHYKVHWDQKDPSVDPIGHLIHVAPHWLVLIALLLIVVLGIA